MTNAPRPESRRLMRYVLYQVDPAWRSLPAEERSLQKKELADLLGSSLPVEVHPYSTVGLRADADICLWEIADGPGPIQDLQARINATELGRLLRPTYSYLAMTKRSQYVDRHEHADGSGEGRRTRVKPTGRRYLFVYPMVKKRAWYRLSHEERQRAMDEHIRIGHEFPRVKINTSYSFGLDDQEFVVAFETDYPGDFLDLVEKLRGGEASAYTERETPIFTCVAGSIADVVEFLG